MLTKRGEMGTVAPALRTSLCDPQLMSWTVRTSNQCSKEPRKPVEIFFFFECFLGFTSLAKRARDIFFFFLN